MSPTPRERQMADEVRARLFGCPPAEELQAWQEGSLPAGRRAAVDSHLASCAPCTAAIAFLSSAGTEEPPGWPPLPAQVGRRSEERIEAVIAGASRSPWGWRITLGAAAALALVAFLTIRQREGRPAEPAYREAAEAGIRSLVPEDAPLSRSGCVLRWAGAPPGTRYDVTVLSDALVVLARGQGLTAPRWQVPEDALAGLAPGATLLWQVEARLPDGGRVASVTFLSRLE